MSEDHCAKGSTICVGSWAPINVRHAGIPQRLPTVGSSCSRRLQGAFTLVLTVNTTSKVCLNAATARGDLSKFPLLSLFLDMLFPTALRTLSWYLVPHPVCFPSTPAKSILTEEKIFDVPPSVRRPAYSFSINGKRIYHDHPWSTPRNSGNELAWSDTFARRADTENTPGPSKHTSPLTWVAPLDPISQLVPALLNTPPRTPKEKIAREIIEGSGRTSRSPPECPRCRISVADTFNLSGISHDNSEEVTAADHSHSTGHTNAWVINSVRQIRL